MPDESQPQVPAAEPASPTSDTPVVDTAPPLTPDISLHAATSTVPASQDVAPETAPVQPDETPAPPISDTQAPIMQTQEGSVSSPVATVTVSPPVQSAPSAAPHFGRYSVAQAAEMARNTHESLFRAKAEKILSYITAHGSITKDQTARLLYVSGNSAYLYLKRLVREGALYRIGHGKSTRYEKVS